MSQRRDDGIDIVGIQRGTRLVHVAVVHSRNLGPGDDCRIGLDFVSVTHNSKPSQRLGSSPAYLARQDKDLMLPTADQLLDNGLAQVTSATCYRDDTHVSRRELLSL